MAQEMVELVPLFADADDEVSIEFEGGVTMVLRRWMDAGIQDDLDREAIRVEIQPDDTRNGNSKGTSPEALQAKISTGNVDLIQRMLLRIDGPDLKLRAPIGKGTIRRFGRPAEARIMDVINEHNLPFSRLRQTKSPGGDLME